MNVKIESTWKEALAEEFEKPYFAELAGKVRSEYLSKRVFPPPKDVFRAFEECPFSNLRVVILGQDPYHNIGQAHGLSFSVPKGVQLPPSLRNIYKEMQSDVGGEIPPDGDLSSLAQQGVLLLNAMLTVIAHSPASHRGIGWEQFTDSVIRTVSEKSDHVVFVLWGSFAKSKASLIDPRRHLILSSAHPSPLSAHAGFFGSRPFSKANEYLLGHGKGEIVWLDK